MCVGLPSSEFLFAGSRDKRQAHCLAHAATMATHSIEGLVRQRDAYKELLEQHETAVALHQSAAAAAAPRPETTAAVSPSLNRLQQLQVRPGTHRTFTMALFT